MLLEAPAAPPAAAAEVNNTVEDQQPSKGTSRETSTAAAEADAEAAAATPDKEKLSVTTGKDSSDETAAGERWWGSSLIDTGHAAHSLLAALWLFTSSSISVCSIPVSSHHNSDFLSG